MSEATAAIFLDDRLHQIYELFPLCCFLMVVTLVVEEHVTITGLLQQTLQSAGFFQLKDEPGAPVTKLLKYVPILLSFLGRRRGGTWHVKYIRIAKDINTRTVAENARLQSVTVYVASP